MVLESEISHWLTPAEAAQRLGVTPLRVRQLLSAGRIPHVQTALGRLVDPDDIERLVEERKRTPATMKAGT